MHAATTRATEALSKRPASSRESHSKTLRSRLTGTTPAGTRHGKLDALARSVDAAARRRGLDIAALGVEPLFDEIRVYGGDAPWLVSPLRRDPMVRNRIPVPESSLRKLSALRDAGLDFPHIYIAHELLPDPRYASIPDGSYIAVTEKDALCIVPEAPPPQSTMTTARRIESAARVVRRGLGATVLGVGTALAAVPAGIFLAALDPAVLGAITVPGDGGRNGTQAAWFVLTHWDWNERKGSK